MTKSSTVLRVLHERQEGLSAVADELNLYYVALTRAKYALHTVFASRSAAADVKYAHNCAEFTDFSVWEKYVAGYSSFTGEKEDRGAIAFCPDEQLAKRISEAFLWKYPYAGFEDLPVKSSATRLSEWGKAEEQPRLTFGKIEEYEEDEQAEEVGLSKEVGIAYHAFLENFDFGRLYEADGRADDQTLLVAVDETLLRLERESASLLNRERLLQILQNPVFDGLRGMRLYKERKFLAELPVSETYGKRAGAPSVWKEGREEKVLFQGAIDLLAVGDGEAIVVDYKYSGHGAQELQTAYAAQLDLYRKATAKILKLDENKVRCVLVNIKRGYQVEIP